MKRTIIIISILAVLPFAVQAQNYGFYGRGQGNSYHKGTNGTTYIGFHPAGMSHSRNAFFGGTDSRRSGSSLPRYNIEQQGEELERAEVSGTYNHADVRVGSHSASGNPAISRGSRVDLGLSTEVSNGRLFGSGGSGSSSDGVYYGRTGESSSAGEGVVSAVLSALPKMATTTNDQNANSGTTVSDQGFMETPDFEAPVGDAVLPLVLLLLPIVIVKIKK